MVGESMDGTSIADSYELCQTLTILSKWTCVIYGQKKSLCIYDKRVVKVRDLFKYVLNAYQL